ncbi:MAG: hypothetical protein GY754_12815 [bacterium]|nr:hypothetical protein [bacterium]
MGMPTHMDSPARVRLIMSKESTDYRARYTYKNSFEFQAGLRFLVF